MDRHGSFSMVPTKALHVGYGMGRHSGKPGSKMWDTNRSPFGKLT